MLPRENADCHQEIPPVTLEIEIRTIVPEGLVIAFSKTNPQIKLWEFKVFFLFINAFNPIPF